MELWIVLGLIGLALVFVVLIYNNLVALKQRCGQAWGDVDVQLKQRHDLIPNLVETVKGYASHEKDTLDAVIKARQQAVSVSGVHDTAEAENILSGTLRQLFALSEAYPDLKANTNFLKLQDELADVEDKIAAARRFFNNAIAEYNTGREQFPAVLFAASFGFEEREFFELSEGERAEVTQAPSVSFS